MEEKLLEIIKKIIENKGTEPKVATFQEVRSATEHIEDKALLNLSFKVLVKNKKLGIRDGINSILIEVL